MRLIVDTQKIVLSSQSQIYKSQRFIDQTKHFAGVDILLSKLSGGIILNLQKFSENSAYSISLQDGRHLFYFKFGQAVKEQKLCLTDIVFFAYNDAENLKRRNDQRLTQLCACKQIVSDINEVRAEKEDFSKLYVLSNADQVNFPLLSDDQKRLVAIEDKNVLAQGVAGSGKTNICISKIVFSACRYYAGKVLYTTFSRGLLLDTQSKVEIFKNNLREFVKDYNSGNVIFVGKNHKKAIENRLGVHFSVNEDDKIISQIGDIIEFLDKKVDYMLLEDLYREYISSELNVVGENYFTKEYVTNIKNHQLAAKLQKIKHLSYEVIYKEIYGMILGCYDGEAPKEMLMLAEYTQRRKDGFSAAECQTIFSIAQDYVRHLKQRKLADNNFISRELIAKAEKINKYSLTVIDEVQDMTEVNLYLMKLLSLKLFCVGDALQMINPSYFSFSYLKRLLFEKDIVSVAELSHNYRNTKSIAELIDRLGEINVRQFGTHSFVLKGDSIDNSAQSAPIFVKDKDFITSVSKQNFDNFTVIVSGAKEKSALRKLLKAQEILTVSEIKGLERDTVVLYNVLSANAEKWHSLERALINRKSADENSVYRYYFNLFYVGISRAKRHLFVAEEKEISTFKQFFAENFKVLDTAQAVSALSDIVSRIEVEQEDVLERINEFVNLGQYDNARFAADKITDDRLRTYQLENIDIYEKYIAHGKYREAGIRYWEIGSIEQAKRYFELSEDTILIQLVDACSGGDSKALDIDILHFLPEVAANSAATALILQTVSNDLHNLKEKQKQINKAFAKIKEKRHG
jgi:hypothetical protein